MRRVGHWTVLAALGLGGLVAAHALGYLLTFQDGHDRAVELSRSGHAYWHHLVSLAVISTTVGLFGQLVLAHRRGVEGELRSPGHLRTRGIQLSLLQVGAFVLIEAGERLVAGSLGPDLLLQPTLWMGIVLQVLFAVAGSLLLWQTDRIAATLHTRRILKPDAQNSLLASTTVHRLFSTQVASDRRPRAPPVAVID